MKARTVAVLGILVMLGMGACKKETETMNNADMEFLDRTAQYHNAAVEFAEVATSRGDNGMVRDYGQMEIPAHNAAMNDLKTLAQKRDYKLPSNPDVEHVAAKIVIKEKSGREFDSMYINLQVYDHIQMVGIMQDEITDGKDNGLKDYARNFLNTADQHKKKADDIVTAMNIKTR